MLVLLPPSESKQTPRRGKPLDLDRLSFPELTATRSQVLDELISLCTASPDQARLALGLSVNQIDEVIRNQSLDTARSAPASQIYTGVLYDALDVATLDAHAQRRAAKTLIVSSALFGAVGFADRIPAYRLSGDCVLPGLGAMNVYWRDPLAIAMESVTAKGLIVDLRSGVYASMWKPIGAVADRTVAIRVLQQRSDGSRSVVSHFNKATKGRLVRRWLSEGIKAKNVDALAEACVSDGVEVELAAKPKKGQIRQLDVIVRDL